jgi:hypothetical protein
MAWYENMDVQALGDFLAGTLPQLARHATGEQIEALRREVYGGRRTGSHWEALTFYEEMTGQTIDYTPAARPSGAVAVAPPVAPVDDLWEYLEHPAQGVAYNTVPVSGGYVTAGDTHFFRVARLGEYDPKALEHCQRAALVCCEQLKIFDVEVLPAVSCGPGEALMGWAGPLWGFSTTEDNRKVYVVMDCGQTLRELIQTTGHECAHVWSGFTHKNAKDHDENFCDVIGFNLAEQLGF